MLFRNNTTGDANFLVTDLDTNGKRILNLPAPVSSNEPVRLIDIQSITGQTPVVDWSNIMNKPLTFAPSAHIHVISDVTGLSTALSAKQDTLVSGTSIKTVNGNSLLGSGDLVISGGGGSTVWGGITGTLSSQTDLNTALSGKQATLVSGTNIKTVGGVSLLGSGDIAVGGTGTVTSVSVASANGFAGSVATSTTTPVITLSTTITGLLKANGTSLSAATAGTDYQSPIGTISGLAKGNGANALTAATAGTDYVSPSVASTYTATQTYNGSSTAFAAAFLNAKETTSIVGTALAATPNVYIASGATVLVTASAANNVVPNFAFSAGTALNTAMSVGDTVTVVLELTQGATAYYITGITIDGTAVTAKWLGGAPTSGNVSGIDSYVFTITKTASATYTVRASQTQYK